MNTSQGVQVRSFLPLLPIVPVRQTNRVSTEPTEYADPCRHLRLPCLVSLIAIYDNTSVDVELQPEVLASTSGEEYRPEIIKSVQLDAYQTIDFEISPVEDRARFHDNSVIIIASKPVSIFVSGVVDHGHPEVEMENHLVSQLFPRHLSNSGTINSTFGMMFS